MGVFDNILHADESLFKNIEALDFEFVPKIVPYREEQQRRIADAIGPLFSDRSGKNLVICGLPGLGKTVANRHVLKELEEKTEDIETIYINCWKRNTSYKVVLEICHQLGYRFTQNKKTDELFRDAVKLLNKTKVVFVFDEIDKAEDYDFLYVFAEEVFKKAFIMITNFKTFLENMDERVKSRMLPEMVEFNPYSRDEIQGILKQRVDYAFFPEVWETDAFEAIVTKSFEMKDVRVGIHLLKDSGEEAESRASKKITLAHAEKVIAKASEIEVFSSTDLKGEEKLMLDVIKGYSESKIGDLYKHYQSAGGKGAYKTFQRKMKILEDKGLVSLTKQEGAGGNTTIIKYNEKAKKLTDY